MQNAQQIDWSSVWEITKTFLPIFVTLGVGYRLSRKTENYKKDLSKEIENYKFQLQSQFYQFQTRFSALHQEQAKVIKESFALLVDINKTIFAIDNKQGLFKDDKLNLFDIDEKKLAELQLNQLTNLVESFNNFNDFYRKNRIFLSPKVCKNIDKIIEESANLMAVRFVGDLVENRLKDEHKEKFRKEDFEKVAKIFTSVSSDDISMAINQLENEFRELISVEAPNQGQTQLLK